MALPLQGSVNPGSAPNAFLALQDWQNLASQFWALYLACKTMYQRQNTHAYVSTYNATQTYSVNSDGSPGNVDGTINTTHPMVGCYLSAQNVSGFDSNLNDFIAYMEGNAVGTADRRGTIQAMMP